MEEKIQKALNQLTDEEVDDAMWYKTEEERDNQYELNKEK